MVYFINHRVEEKKKKKNAFTFSRLRQLYGKITLEHTKTYTKKERDFEVEVAKDHEVIESSCSQLIQVK